MPTYFAFVRGLNVGGNGMLPMEKLRPIVERAGFTNVKTFIQSGNVSVDSHLRSNAQVAKKMENAVRAETKLKAEIFVRTREEIEAMVNAIPFGKIKQDEKTKLYVLFLSEMPKIKTPVFLKSTTQGTVELIRLKDNVAYLISRKVGDEWGGPTLEKDYHLRATSRNWNTILRMLK